jgi:ParB family chromosome partitioning protein
MIAVSLEGQQSSPSLSQAKRMRELEGKGMLNGDVIDAILCEQKKEVDKVIIFGKELNECFGKDKTPQQMKEQIIKLLDDWSGKQKELAPSVKKTEKEK